MEAVNQLEQILDVTDVVMVARGDLGVEVDLALVPIFQKRIIRLCNLHRIPVITATQMLDSMTHNSRPTRAEAADVANAVLDGTDAIMLSGETAAGEYPAEAVATMSRIAHEAERILHPHRQVDTHSQPRSRALAVTEAVTLGASRAADHLAADLVVVATRGGKTAMAMSRQRSHTPILGISDSPETARRMCLYWGVTPLQSDKVNAPVQDLLKFVVDWCRRPEHPALGQQARPRRQHQLVGRRPRPDAGACDSVVRRSTFGRCGLAGESGSGEWGVGSGE